MSAYCSRQDVRDRLGSLVANAQLDDDGDSLLSEAELVAGLDPAIRFASAEIDFAVIPWSVTPLPAVPDWVRGAAVLLAVEHVLGRKAGLVVESAGVAAARVREVLGAVRRGEVRLPGLPYPVDGFSDEVRELGLPRRTSAASRPLGGRAGGR